MLTRLYVDNFRTFVNFELQPQKSSLLMGTNGSGKSSVLDVLWNIRSVARYGLDVAQAFPAFSRTSWQLKGAQRFELEVQGNGGTYFYALEVEHTQEFQAVKSAIKSEAVTFNGKPLFTYSDSSVHLFSDAHEPGPQFNFGARRSFLASVEPGPTNRRLTWFTDWLDRMQIFNLQPASIIQGWSATLEARALNRNGDNFAAFYRHVVQDQPEIASVLSNDLREHIDGFDQLRLVQMGDARALSLRFAPENEKEFELPFPAISDGQAVLIVLYALLRSIAGKASLLCIDEPDNFLALPEIQPWLVQLTDALSAGEGQALVVSHHPETIDYLAADSVILLGRKGGGLTRASKPQLDSSDGLKLSEIVARGWNLGHATQ